jgi:DNA topoisomerase-1
VVLRDGRYGPYVSHGKINATLPKSVKPEEITLDEALDLLSVKAAKVESEGGAKPKARRAAKK